MSIVVIIVDDGVKLYFVLVKFDLIAVNRDREWRKKCGGKAQTKEVSIRE